MSTSWSESSEISDSRSSWEAGEGEHWELSKAPLFCSLGTSGLWSQGSSKLSSSSFLLLWGFSWLEDENEDGQDHEIWKGWDTNQTVFSLSFWFLIYQLLSAIIFLSRKYILLSHFGRSSCHIREKLYSCQVRTTNHKYNCKCIVSNEHLTPAQIHDLKILKSLGGKRNQITADTHIFILQIFKSCQLTGPCRHF